MEFDCHTLNVCHPKLSKEELGVLFSGYATALYSLLGESTKPQIFVNAVFTREGQNTGIAYIYCKDSRVYQAILGRNVDGTKRVQTDFTQGDTSDWAEDVVETELPPLLPPPVSEKGPLRIGRAFVEEPDEDKESNSLICHSLPHGTRREDIARVTSPFSSVPKYPVVTQHGPVMKVTYAPHTNDALFALHMLRCYPFRRSPGDAPTKIYFSLASKKRRE